MSRQNRRNPNSTIPLILFAAGVVFILAAVIWTIQQGGTPARSVAEAPANTNPAAVPLPGIARVSVEEARAAYEGGEAVFLDVRNEEGYAESHVPGAILMPEWEVGERLGELDPEKWVITY
jgi:hypothetical protein